MIIILCRYVMNDIDRIEILMLEFILTEISRSYSLILYHHLSIYNDISISIGVFLCYLWYVNYYLKVDGSMGFTFSRVSPFMCVLLRNHVICTIVGKIISFKVNQKIGSAGLQMDLRLLSS